MLHIPNIEEIEDLLRKTPNCILLYEQHDSLFINTVKAWLAEIETILQKNRLSIVAEITSLRATLISTERGKIPEGLNFLKRMTKRKLAEFVAEHAIRLGVEIITKVINQDKERINAAELQIIQLVALARQAGLIEAEPIFTYDHSKLGKRWEDFKTVSDTAERKLISSWAIAVQTMVGKINCIILLDKILTFK
jgi:hypothetical protein